MLNRIWVAFILVGFAAALVQTVQGMSNGYQVIRDGTPTLGQSAEVAADWLDRLRESTADASLRSVPYADVDAAAMVRAGMSNDLVRAVTQGPVIAEAGLTPVRSLGDDLEITDPILMSSG